MAKKISHSFILSFIFLVALASCFKRRPTEEEALLQTTRANAQMLTEIYKVLLEMPVGNQDAFRSWVHSLNEGMSLEGMYRGFTRSAQFREMEMNHLGVTPKALNFFVDQVLLFTPHRVFRTEDARPLSKISFDGLEAGFRVEEYGAPLKTSSREDLIRLFRAASPFTLKRILGDSALSFLNDLKNHGSSALNDWYGHWAADWAGKKIDFGLDLRNQNNETFHKQWAKDADYNRLVWEVLNRLFRVFDVYQKESSS